ncbi:MAG: hypothetical protein LBK66_00200, partial [Spirochaetaceae bacterium]|nr:hypothetical protein [Spirochaetaceae bacterium]
MSRIVLIECAADQNRTVDNCMAKDLVIVAKFIDLHYEQVLRFNGGYAGKRTVVGSHKLVNFFGG